MTTTCCSNVQSSSHNYWAKHVPLKAVLRCGNWFAIGFKMSLPIVFPIGPSNHPSISKYVSRRRAMCCGHSLDGVKFIAMPVSILSASSLDLFDCPVVPLKQVAWHSIYWGLPLIILMCCHCWSRHQHRHHHPTMLLHLPITQSKLVPLLPPTPPITKQHNHHHRLINLP